MHRTRTQRERFRPRCAGARILGLRDVFSEFETTTGIVVSSIELRDRTKDAARSAFISGIPFDALCADLGRNAAEVLERDQLTAITVGRAMAQWAAPIHMGGDGDT